MKLLCLIIAITFSITAFPQRKRDKYFSTEEETYRQTHRYKPFEPTDVSTVKSFKLGHIKLRRSETSNPFVSVWEPTFWEKYFQSLEKPCRDAFNQKYPPDPHDTLSAERYLKYIDSLEKASPKVRDISRTSEYQKASQAKARCIDSIMTLRMKKTIAGITYDEILRIDSTERNWAIVYKSFGYANGLVQSVWIATSKDRGKSWKKYFSGLLLNNFIYIKPEGKIALAANDSTIQLEVALVRQVSPRVYPLGGPTFELIDDNLIAELNVNDIIRDSDGDGITDLLEKRFSTNPHSNDTDGDGIEDAVDKNPRFKDRRDKYTSLFQYFLEQGSADAFIPFNKFQQNVDTGEFRTQFIITDDSNLLNLISTTGQYVLMTTSEFEHYKKENPGEVHQVYVSPFFAVDRKKKTWKVSVSFGFAGDDYLVIEKKNGWQVKLLGSWIS